MDGLIPLSPAPGRPEKRQCATISREVALIDNYDEVNAIEDAAVAYMSKERRTKLRQDEIAKLEAFTAFIPVPRGQVPHDVCVLYPCWVDTGEQSRLTVADKK